MTKLTLKLEKYTNEQLSELQKVLSEIDNEKALIIKNYLESTEEEEEVPITLYTIKNTCGWSKFCDITGANHYMLKEWTVPDKEIFYVKKSHAEKLNLL